MNKFIKKQMFLVILVLGLSACLPVNLAAYAFSNGQNAHLVIGQSNFTTSTFATTQSGLGTIITDAKFDPSGNLWVGDANNNRILQFIPPAASTSVVSVPEFPLGGIALLFVVTGVVYVLIRYRVFNPTNLRIHH